MSASNTQEHSLLDIKDLVIEYRTGGKIVHAVNSLSLEVGRGETLGFVGETGAGKTTTALGILRILPDPPSKIVGGQVFFEGEDLLKKSPEDMRKVRGKDIAMIFQDPMTSLDPVITVSQQIQEMIKLHEKVTAREAAEKAEAMLEIVGIKRERANDYPHQFSGGMKQRVVIAIALACNPKLLIADEPTTALDVTIQAQVLELMKDLKSQYKMSMIMITHDLGIVAEICDKVAIMYAGNIVEYGTALQVYENHRHPYTDALFNSIPSIDTEIEELSVIPGLPPDPTDLPPGCPFSPRCAYTGTACTAGAPGYFEVEPGHFVRCVKYAGGEV